MKADCAMYNEGVNVDLQITNWQEDINNRQEVRLIIDRFKMKIENSVWKNTCISFLKI